MRSISKIMEKKHQLRSAIFNSGTISRRELISKTGLNPRSVAIYANELARLGIISQDTRENEYGGRPSIYYRSHSEKLCGLGIYLLRNEISLVIIDINSQMLFARMIVMPDDSNIMEMTKLVFREIDQFLKMYPDKILARIGLSRNSCHRGMFYDAIKELSFAMHQHFSCPVELLNSDEAILLNKILNSNTFEPAVMVSGGDELNLAIVENRNVTDKLRSYTKRLHHLQGSIRSPEKCYCGKYHCLGNTLTIPGIVKRYCHLKGMAPGAVQIGECYGAIHSAGNAGEAAAGKILEECGQLWAELLYQIENDLHIKHIFLALCDPITFRALTAAYRELSGKELLPHSIFKYSNSDILTASAQVALYKVFNQYGERS